MMYFADLYRERANNYPFGHILRMYWASRSIMELEKMEEYKILTANRKAKPGSHRSIKVKGYTGPIPAKVTFPNGTTGRISEKLCCYRLKVRMDGNAGLPALQAGDIVRIEIMEE